MAEHPTLWTSPAPLWNGAASPSSAGAFRRPAILRFSTDAFMDQFLGTLDAEPDRLGEYVAKFETWEKPAPHPAGSPRRPNTARRLEGMRRISLRNQQARALLSSGPPPQTSLRTTTAIDPADGKPLKLYQPAHQRHYLVSAGLVCGVAGLPDRRVDKGRAEGASFVLRRLRPKPTKALDVDKPIVPADVDEYAFLSSPRGGAWKLLAEAERGKLAAHEDQTELFAVQFRAEDGHRRRVWAGAIPVGKREAYLTAGDHAPGTGGADERAPDPAASLPPKTARLVQLRLQATEPWKAICRTSRNMATRALKVNSGTPPKSAAVEPELAPLRAQLHTQSWYTLLDLAAYLETHLGDLWARIIDPSATAAGLSVEEQNLFADLNATAIPNPGPVRSTLLAEGYAANQIASSLRDALRRCADPTVKAKLESADTPYLFDKKVHNPAWPAFVFPLAYLSATYDINNDDLQAVTAVPTLPPTNSLPADDDRPPTAPLDEPADPATADEVAWRDSLKRVDALAARVIVALADFPPEPAPPTPDPPAAVTAARAAAAANRRGETDGVFQIRCVFERPNCGPLEGPLVSEPTVPFRLAPFFDPEAPARAVHITMPADTTPAGLRKFAKNTAFQFSDVLCGQMDYVKGLTLGDLVLSVLPWPFHKSLPSFSGGGCKAGGSPVGSICTFSLPIITLCALVVLMVIVLLLDLIFKWLPWFVLCFPLPGFKAKKA